MPAVNAKLFLTVSEKAVVLQCIASLDLFRSFCLGILIFLACQVIQG